MFFSDFLTSALHFCWPIPSLLKLQLIYFCRPVFNECHAVAVCASRRKVVYVNGEQVSAAGNLPLSVSPLPASDGGRVWRVFPRCVQACAVTPLRRRVSPPVAWRVLHDARRPRPPVRLRAPHADRRAVSGQSIIFSATVDVFIFLSCP